MDLEQLIPFVNARFAWAAGMTLKSAALTEKGFEFYFENEAARVEIRFIPRLYPEGRLVIDAVNDLTIQVEIKRQPLDGSDRERVEQVEIPYAAWFGDSFM